MARRKQSPNVKQDGGWHERRWRCLDADDVRAICESAELDPEPERIERLMFRINLQILVLNKVSSWSKTRTNYRRIKNLQEVQHKIEDLWSSLWKVTDYKDLHAADAWITHHVQAGDIKFEGPLGRETGFYDPRDDFPDLGDVHSFPMPSADSFSESPRLLAGIAKNLAAFHLACRFAQKRAQRGLRSDGNPKRPDFWRYQLVTRLAECYEEALELRPTSTRGGTWCRFLAEALRKCERAGMTDDAVYDLWLKVKRSRPGRVSLSS